MLNIGTIKVTDRYFLANQVDRFEQFLATVNSDTRTAIRKNDQLNELYDLFLDFILDSNQHLNQCEAKEVANNTEKTGRV